MNSSQSELNPVNVYIDTCSLIQLLDERKGDFFVDNLVFWTSNGRINLFTHEIIIGEWNKHKERKRKDFETSLRAKYKNAREVSQLENIVIPNIEPNTEKFDGLIRKIDALLSSSHRLETNDSAKIKSSEHNVPPKRAPFLVKADSTKDAFIIFSALEYFKSILTSFVFVSQNYTEFADPADPLRKIHPDLVSAYQGVTVDYYQEIGIFINEHRNILDISLVQEDKVQRTEKANSVIQIDRNKPMLDQLVEYLEQIHFDVVYVPPRIVINHYPFLIGNQNSIYYSLFTAETSNEKLIEVFQKMSVSEEGALPDDLDQVFPDVTDAKSKCEKVLRFLNGDLIFNVSNRKNSKTVHSRYLAQTVCSCLLCQFRNFRFKEAFAQLGENPNDEKEALNLAYANYQTGNYLRAFDTLLGALQGAEQKGLATTAFIIHFNLYNLSTFIFSHYYKDTSAKEKASYGLSLKIKEVAQKYSQQHNAELLKFVAENNFYEQARNKIFELHYKIIDQYNDSLRGGYSSNYHVWALKNYFIEFDSIVLDNRLVFDKFSNFLDVCERTFEAMFASHAIAEVSGSRLPDFDDWILHRMLLYGNSERLKKSCVRYNLKTISYAGQDQNDPPFIQLLNNFFESHKELRSSFESRCEPNNRAFWDFYNRIFSNAMTLVSIVNIGDANLKLICERIVTFLEEETFIHPMNTDNVTYFVRKLDKKLDISLLTRVFWVALKSKKYRNHNVLDATCDRIRGQQAKVSISTDDFEIIKGNLLTKDEHGAITKIDHSIFSVYRVVESDHILNELTNTVSLFIMNHFSFHFYYLAVMNNVIPYDDNYFNPLFEETFPGVDRRKITSHIFGGRSDRFDGVNDLLNLSFRFNLDLQSPRFSPIKALGPYYEWLLDMEGFDYSKFDPDWISEYKTRYYLQRIANSLKVKEFLESHLKNEIVAKLEKEYYNIYIRKPWAEPVID